MEEWAYMSDARAAAADTTPPADERSYQAVDTGTFAWARIDARWVVQCRHCAVPARRCWAALVDYRDRSSCEAQRRAVDGEPCRGCGRLQPLPGPVLQLRPGDGVGLLVGFPAISDAEDDKLVIRETLSAGAVFDLAGACAVASVPLDWWGRVWNRPLGPGLARARPLDLPTAAEEAELWRTDTVRALDLPDIRATLHDFITAVDDRHAEELLRAAPVLVDPRWRLTVDLLVDRLRDAQPNAASIAAVDARFGVLRLARLAGAGYLGVAGGDTARAISDVLGAGRDRLSRVRELVATFDDSVPAALHVATQLALVEAMRANGDRSPDFDEQLVAAARKTLVQAHERMGAAHDMTIAAAMNLAVCLQERVDADHASGVVEAQQILAEFAPRAARAASPILADLAMNLATLAVETSDIRSDKHEDADRLLKDAAHIRTVTTHDRQPVALALLVDQAAALRGRASGDRRANLHQAVALLRQARDRTDDWAALSAPEQVLLRSNIANALRALRQRDIRAVTGEEVVSAAREAIAACQTIDDAHPVAVTTRSNAGSILCEQYSESMISGQAQPELRAEAIATLDAAVADARTYLIVDHPETLRAEMHLAAAEGTPLDGQMPGRARCAELLGGVIDRAAADAHDLRFAAASNLGQLRTGEGDWRSAAAAFGQAAGAQRALIARARTWRTKLSEAMQTADITVRHALALTMSGAVAEAVAALEANRARLRHADREATSSTVLPTRPADQSRGQRPAAASVWSAACDFGTVSILRGPDGQTIAHVDALNTRRLRPAVADLLEAETSDERRTAFDALARQLRPTVVDPINTMLAALDAPPAELHVVTSGPLASCPLACIPGDDGRTWIDRFVVRQRITASDPLDDHPELPAVAVGIFDPDADLPFAATERDALKARVEEVHEPPATRSARAWLIDRLPQTRFLHLACHARLDPEDPMRSAFLLGDGEALTVADIGRIAAANLDLVIASACQSGSASPDAPDELLGVGHALVLAGARSVVASAWDADDAATALCISVMLRELRTSDAAPALAVAQRTVATVTADQLSDLVSRRLAVPDTPSWLPYDLAIELDALLARPATETDAPVFGHPTLWGALSVLER